MNICGIIVEYNPLTNGHLYHLQKAKEMTNADLIIAVMSGNFTQRGEPAIVDKWQRAKAAIDNGVDLVIELPFAFACESADYFSKGAIEILTALHCNSIVFGSETYQKEDYDRLLQKSKSPLYQQELERLLNAGYSYPQATSLAFQGEKITLPNDILGFSYVKEIHRQNSPIQYQTIQRTTNYHDPNLQSASASSLRIALKQQQIIQAYSPMQPEGYLHDIEELFEPLYQRLILSRPEDLKLIHMVNEGIEYRLISKIQEATNMKEFLELVKTRRYTTPRILRTIIHILVNDTSDSRENQHIGYIRLLGASLKGRKSLRQLKEICPLPIISNFSEISHPHLDLELATTKLYALAYPIEKRNEIIKQEYATPPYTKKP